MQVQPISNVASNVKFGSIYSQEYRDTLTDLVNMDDSELATIAQLQAARHNNRKSHEKTMNTVLYSLPIVAGLSSGILHKGSLGSKTAVALGSGASWGFALALLGVYDFAKKAIFSKSEKLQNFEQNNPALSLLADLGLFWGVLTIGNKAVAKGWPKLLEKAPNLATKALGLAGNVVSKLDNSSLNKKVLTRLAATAANFSKKAPWLSAAGSAVLGCSTIIVLLAGLMRGVSSAAQENNRVHNNYKRLKANQFEIAKALANDGLTED